MTASAFSGYEHSPLRQLTGNCLRPGGLELTRHALELCALPPGSRVLDLGCGPGASLGLLRERGYDGLGLDRSAPLLAEAALPVLRGDVHALPLEDSRLDGILCECVLSLARDKAAVLGECFRVLRPGGRLVLSDLIVRGESLAPGAAAAPCVAGAVSLQALEHLLRVAGFTLLFREDHSRCLQELAARIVWHFGSLAAFAELWRAGERPVEEAAPACPSGKNLGYTLLIAQKGEKENDHETARHQRKPA